MSGEAAAHPGIIATCLLACAIGGGYASAQEPSPSPLRAFTRVYDRKQLLTSPTLSNDARRGRALWLQRCAYCHDGLGQPTYKTMGPWLGAETVQLLGEDALRVLIGTGTERMPGFGYSLQPQQVNQLIAFLKTVTPDQKPTPEQLATRSSGAAVIGSGD